MLILEAPLNTVDIKNSKVYSGFKGTTVLLGMRKLPAENLGGQSYQYLRLLSPSDTLFIVKSGTCMDLVLVRLYFKIHLTLRAGVKCIVSSQEPERLQQ